MKQLSAYDLQQAQLLNATLHQLASSPGSPTKGQFYMSTATNTLHYYNGTSDYDSGIAAHSISELLAPTGALAMAGYKITGLATGVSSTDAANVGNITTAIQTAVDAIIAGLAYKTAARVVYVANTALTGITANDSVTFVNGDRVLLTAQTTASQNGIYVWATGGTLTRAGDSANNYELEESATWIVSEGSLGTNQIWRVSSIGTITPGTTSLSILNISMAGTVYTAGLNVAITSQVISVPFGTFPKKYAVAVGNGSNTSFTITHALGLVAVNGVYPCTVQLFDTSGNLVGIDVQSATANTVVLANFTTAPASNAYTVVVTG